MKIVIAEDDLVTREILKRILTRVVDEMLEASNGIEALELVETDDPDFLFTELHCALIKRPIRNRRRFSSSRTFHS
ncbi:MAG: hypothetical protein ABIT38_05980 [Gemmatimonadaceae bacterium]